METLNNKNESNSDLSKMELDYLQHICRKGFGGYSSHIPELDSLVDKGLLTVKHANMFNEDVYYPSELAKKVMSL